MPDNGTALSGWTFNATEIAEAVQGKRLLNPSLDLGNPCNLNCPYCFVEEKNSARKVRFADEMTAEEISLVINDFADHGARSVNLVGAGEPTIDRLFPSVIEAIASRGMTPVVFTNGLFLGQRTNLTDLLYDTGATVVLKFNSRSAEKQDAVAGRRGYTEKRDITLQQLLDRGFAAHSPTRLAADIIVFKGVLDEIPDLLRFCRDGNIFPIIADFIPTGRTDDGQFIGHAAFASMDRGLGRIANNLLEPPSNGERSELFSKLAIIDRDSYSIGRTAHCAYYSGAPCTQLLGLYVDNHGSIWPCVAKSKSAYDWDGKEPLGNIRNGDLPSKLWSSDPYLELLRKNYEGACPYKARLEG